MPIRPTRQSDAYKMACHWKKEAEWHRDYVERNPGMQLGVRIAFLQFAAIQEQQAAHIFQTI